LWPHRCRPKLPALLLMSKSANSSAASPLCFSSSSSTTAANRLPMPNSPFSTSSLASVKCSTSASAVRAPSLMMLPSRPQLLHPHHRPPPFLHPATPMAQVSIPSFMFFSTSYRSPLSVILPRSGPPGPPPTADTLRLLFSRTRHGRYKDVAAILSQGIPVDIRDEFGNTPLLIAAQNGHLKIVKMLLRSRAHINAQNHKGMSAMHFAFTFGYPELGAYLVSKGGDDALKNCDNRTCYECSSSSNLQSLTAPADSLRSPLTPAPIDPWSSAASDPFSPLSLQSPEPSTPGPFSDLASSWGSVSSMSASDGALHLARAAQQHAAAQEALLPARTGRTLSAAAASAAALPSTPTVSYFMKQESSISLPPSPGSPYQQPADALSSRDTERIGSAVGILSRGDSLGV
jgi:hypothetical protein